MGRLSNKVAIVTGAAGGQGKEEAKLFAEEGAMVVATDVNENLLNETVKEINAAFDGERVIGIKHDVSNEANWEDVVAKTVEKFKKIDILINNAGISGDSYDDLWNFDTEEAKKVLEINALGNMLGIKTVIPEMKKAGGGSIVNISSVSGMAGGFSGQNLAYAASKGANRLLTKDMALNVARDNIRVNSVHPGMVKTPILENVNEELLKEIEKGIPL